MMLYSTTAFQSEADPSLASWDLCCNNPPLALPCDASESMSPRASVGDGCLPLQLGLSDSNPAWTTPAITPYQIVELIKPAAVATTCQAHSCCRCSLSVTNAVGQGWSPVFLHEAWRQWHPAQDIPSQANVQAGEFRAAGSRCIVEHGHSIAEHDAFGFNVMGSKMLKKIRASFLCCLG